MSQRDDRSEKVNPAYVLRAALSVVHARRFAESSGTSSARRSFRQKCDAAAELNAGVARLRTAGRRIGILPISIHLYIERLAVRAAVHLPPLLEYFGLAHQSPRESGFARSWAELAQTIGLAPREAAVIFRLTVAEFLSARTMPAPARLRGPGRTGGSRVDQIEDCVEQFVQRMGDKHRQQIRELEFEFADALEKIEE